MRGPRVPLAIPMLVAEAGEGTRRSRGRGRFFAISEMRGSGAPIKQPLQHDNPLQRTVKNPGPGFSETLFRE